MEVKVKMKKGKEGLYVPSEIAEKQKIKIFIPLLHYKPILDITLHSLYASVFNMLKKYPNFYIKVSPQSSTDIVSARHWCIEAAKKLEANYIWFVDEDLRVNYNTLQLLYESKKDIVSAGIFRRSVITEPLFTIFQENPDDILEKMLVPFWNYPKNSLFPVATAGIGCMLIKTTVFEKIPEPYFKFYQGVKEDTFFCLRMRENKIKTWVNSKAKTWHIQVVYRFVGEEIYDGQRKELEELEKKRERKHCSNCVCRLCKEISCSLTKCINCQRKIGYKTCPETPEGEK